MFHIKSFSCAFWRENLNENFMVGVLFTQQRNFFSDEYQGKYLEEFDNA
jgi:hypothetical protein